MKQLLFAIALFLMTHTASVACTVCKSQQPKVLQGITHGAGPESNWDYFIVAAAAVATLATLVFSLKHLIRPGETSTEHIKRSILNSQYE